VDNSILSDWDYHIQSNGGFERGVFVEEGIGVVDWKRQGDERSGQEVEDKLFLGERVVFEVQDY
jgi:hypothetical protein